MQRKAFSSLSGTGWKRGGAVECVSWRVGEREGRRGEVAGGQGRGCHSSGLYGVMPDGETERAEEKGRRDFLC